ncbi:MAG: LON peptidase substrate-binding domain-containing protein [Gammaproteobacteria bacterium]|nr:LON peptidase substrate-binding domain-containing protein [Gammaproteobacteria bacterium]
MTQSFIDLPLFPLHALIFPGGLLPLRIFEPRYVDMMSRCMRENQPFGICAIAAGKEIVDESGQVATPHRVGTLVNIIDFKSLPDGLLGILVQGQQKFEINSTRINHDNLLLGNITLLATESAQTIHPQHQHLVELLQRAWPDWMQHYGETMMQYIKPDFQDAGWVSARLAEMLPLRLDVKQALLLTDDSQERMAVLDAAMAQLTVELGETMSEELDEVAARVKIH